MASESSVSEADVNQILNDCRKVSNLNPGSVEILPPTVYSDLEEYPLLGSFHLPLLLRPGPSNFDLDIFSAEWLQENEPQRHFSVFSSLTQETFVETVPAVVSRLSAATPAAHPFIGLAKCPSKWIEELGQLTKLNPDSIEYEKQKTDVGDSKPNAFEGNPNGVYVCAMPKGFVFPLRKNSSANAEIMFSTPQALGSIVWLVAHPKGESRALEAAVSQASVVFAVADLSTFLSPIYAVVQRPGDLVVFPSGCFFQGLCCDHYSLAVSTMVPAYAQMLLPLLTDGSLESSRNQGDSSENIAAQHPANPPDGIHFNPAGPQPTPRRVGPFSLFPTIRQVLAEAGASGIEVYQIVDIINRDVRFVRTLPHNITSTLAVLLALNFMRARTHSKANGMFEKQYVAPLKSSDLPTTTADRVKWRWVGEKATKERIADVLFELETAFWFAITRQLFRVDWSKKNFEILYDVGTPKQPDAAPYSSSQKADLHRQEQQRFSHPNFSFEYRVAGSVPVCVGPIDNVASVTMKTSHLVMDRPPAAKVTSVVADAAARLPGGVGSRADVERLLLESHYAGPDLRNNPDLVRSTVTGALDRMSRAEDPPVKFCREVKLWVYRYRQRLHGDFAPNAEDELPLRGPKKMYLLANAPIAFPIYRESSGEFRSNDSPPRRSASPAERSDVSLISSSTVAQTTKPRYFGPALMTATKMPGLRTVWWSAAGNRRPIFAGTEPRSASRILSTLCPSLFERHERSYRLIRDSRRDGAAVEHDALTLLHKYKAGAINNTTRKRRAAADASSASTAAIIMMHKRSASAAHQATVAAAEAVAYQVVTVADPLFNSGPPASNLRALEPDPIDESIIDPLKRFRVPIFFPDAPTQVFRSSQTDPSFLEDNCAPAAEDLADIPLFRPPAFDSITRFGVYIPILFPQGFCFNELEKIESHVSTTIMEFRASILRSEESVPAAPSDSNLDSKPLPRHRREDRIQLFTQSTGFSRGRSYPEDVGALRLVELPSAVGYIHWLQDLENAVDERMWYHDWRPKARFSQKVKNDKAPEALLLTDPWRMHELRSKSWLPCNSIEAHRWLSLSCATLPELSLNYRKIFLSARSIPPPEFARQKLPMDGRWAPFPWCTLYEEEILYEDPLIEDGRKKRRSSTGKVNQTEEDVDDSDLVPAGKRRAAARAAVAVRSTFDDSADDEELPKLPKSFPYGTRRATLSSGSAWTEEESSNAASTAAPRKRKRDDSDYVGPAFAQNARKRTFAPFAPKSEDEKRREKLFAASKARRRNVALPGPESSPHLCCRVVLMKIRGKPWWPAALLTKEGLHHFALKHFNGGEYVWPFRPDESYPWVSEKCINPFVTLDYLDELLDGYHYDAVVDTDAKAEEFMYSQYDLWIEALLTARDFLSQFYELLDGNSQADLSRFKNLPRQLPGVAAPRYATLEDANTGQMPAPDFEEHSVKRPKIEDHVSSRGKSHFRGRGRGLRGRGRRGGAVRGGFRSARAADSLGAQKHLEQKYASEGDDGIDDANGAEERQPASDVASTLPLPKKGGKISKKLDFWKPDEPFDNSSTNPKKQDLDPAKLSRVASSGDVNSSQESVLPISQQPWTGLSLGASSSSQSDGEQPHGLKRKRKSGATTDDNPDDLTNLIGMTTKRTKTLAAQAAERAALQAYASRGYFHPRRESKRAAAQAAAAVVASAVAAQAEEDRYLGLTSSKSLRSRAAPRGSNRGGRPKAPRRNLPKLVFSSDEEQDGEDTLFKSTMLATDLVEAVQAEEAPTVTFQAEQGEDTVYAALLGLASIAESESVT